MTAIDFTTLLFEKAAVVVAAGTAYGKYGEGFVRISLTVPDAGSKRPWNGLRRSLPSFSEWHL